MNKGRIKKLIKISGSNNSNDHDHHENNGSRNNSKSTVTEKLTKH